MAHISIIQKTSKKDILRTSYHAVSIQDFYSVSGVTSTQVKQGEMPFCCFFFPHTWMEKFKKYVTVPQKQPHAPSVQCSEQHCALPDRNKIHFSVHLLKNAMIIFFSVLRYLNI